MTRLWGVPVVYLCQDHLLGEHSEMHQEAGTLLNHPHGDAIVDGHAKKGQVRVSLLEPRHDVLVNEMNRRGMNHDSPFEYDLSECADRGYVNPFENLLDLYARCDDCADRIDFHGDLL